MTKNISNIEKCAKLMGYKIVPHVRKPDIILICKPGKENSNSEWFAPLTNKADLMDLECALGIDVAWFDADVFASLGDSEELMSSAKFADHPDKFTARAHAVIAVAVQIYDRTIP